jgi:hypothetical protein
MEIYSSEETTNDEGNQIIHYKERSLDHIKILDIIIQKIARKKSEDQREVWKRMKNGQFTGEIKSLDRDVEQTFGKGSMRVLAALDSGTKEGLSFNEVRQKILAYFESDDETEKDTLADEVLNYRENYKYKIRKKK